MNKSVFSPSLRILIVLSLLLAVLFSRELSQKLILAAVAVWLLFMAASFLLNRHKKKGKKTFSPRTAFAHIFPFVRDSFVKEASSDSMSSSPAEYHPPVLPEKDAAFSEAELAQILQHIRLRIIDKLKSAYAEATWQWDKEPDLHDILAGKTFRILVENMENYTHADISFDRFGRIHVEPMTIGAFSPAESKTAADDADAPAPEEPAVVDVRVWYELIGQKILTEQITELHAKGHSRLTIMENGDITVKNQKKDILKATLDSFPASNYWQELVSILAENQLTAKITGNSLQVSWI
ncbi:MAG: hypothetical protein SOY47_10200 [Lachnospiraceae bacterium]|nr:hypothetical protein [Lachnospiraceae bacterium]